MHIEKDRCWFCHLFSCFFQEDVDFYILRGSVRFVCVQKPGEGFVRAQAGQGTRAVPLFVVLMCRKVQLIAEVFARRGRRSPVMAGGLGRLEQSRPRNAQLFLIGNSAPMADLHSGARTSLNPRPCQTQRWGEGRRSRGQKQEGGESWSQERRERESTGRKGGR